MLYLSGIVIAFFISLVLLSRRNKTRGDRIMAAWMAVTGFHLVTFYLMFTARYDHYAAVIALGFPLPLVQGPFLYLYTKLQTSSKPFRRRYLLHFLPVLISYLMFSPFFFLGGDEQAAIFQQQGKGYEMRSMINLYAVYASGIIYSALSLKILLRYRKRLVLQFSNTERINFNWLLYLIIWMAAIWTIILFVRKDELIFGAAAFFVMWLGFFSLRQVQVFNEKPDSLPFPENAPTEETEEAFEEPAVVTVPEKKPDLQISGGKYLRSTLSDADAEQIHHQLKKLMADEAPYKNPDLTLNDLARRIGVHPNHLSQVINSKENKSFYDLINEQRVQAFIKCVAEPSQQQFTLLGIALDCGFNSKASFNRNFKKYTGQTPSDFLKKKAA